MGGFGLAPCSEGMSLKMLLMTRVVVYAAYILYVVDVCIVSMSLSCLCVVHVVSDGMFYVAGMTVL